MKFTNVMGLSVYNGNLEEIPFARPASLMNTISPNSYGMATRDHAFMRALRETDFLVLDGVYFGLASILTGKGKIRVNNGPMVFRYFIEKLGREGGSVFFLGSTERTLGLIRERLQRDYPQVRFHGYSPPFKASFSDEENAEMVKRINEVRPDVVFVGMTAPKQEKWAHQHCRRLDTKIVASIGAVFDWYAGNEKEIAPIWWKLHLAWLVRTIRRPEILKRYPNIAIFFWHLLLSVLRIRKFHE